MRHFQTEALTSPTSGGRSVGIVRSRTNAKEFSFFFSLGVRKVWNELNWLRIRPLMGMLDHGNAPSSSVTIIGLLYEVRGTYKPILN
jgi:hypothetical protein